MQLITDAQIYVVQAKVTPPMLKSKVGVFATRSPHRPNPVGVTLVRLEDVSPSRRTVSVSGLDLIEGTPILDIKPYVPGSSQTGLSRVPGMSQLASLRSRNISSSVC